MANALETEEQARNRFQSELEFVQCLANPNYLNFLAQRGYLREKPFVNYLKYLLYWKDPEYAKYLKYPQCLHMLELLQYEHFRKELVNAQCAKFIDEQQLLHWQHYSRKHTAAAGTGRAAAQQRCRQVKARTRLVSAGSRTEQRSVGGYCDPQKNGLMPIWSLGQREEHWFCFCFVVERWI
ncbi:hypothetical protein GJAV_G00059130 [Gymnothorax javanicus]|nr:hypothetical protein GJAV_G00059130 [Gymnothorax javanicus]